MKADPFLKILVTVEVAIIILSIVLICDFLLKKLSSNGRFGRFVSKEYCRMVLSYLCGIYVFLLGVGIADWLL